ncbi:MAG: hypothetical protein R3C53_14845 [Pirellulaceae bacterium]
MYWELGGESSGMQQQSSNSDMAGVEESGPTESSLLGVCTQQPDTALSLQAAVAPGEDAPFFGAGSEQ